MDKLHFKLQSNEDILIELDTSYFIKDDVINFTVEDNVYRFNTTKHILNKENKESIMNIDMLNNEIIYVYKELNKEFVLPVDNNNLLKDDKYIKYSYEIKDNDITNIIEISY